MKNDSQLFSFAIDLPVRREWHNIELLRASVQSCFTAVFADIDGCNALSMVTGELLENAMKYGAWDSADNSDQTFRLRVVGSQDSTTVTVENPIGADRSAVAQLQKTLEWIGSFESSAHAYRARLLEIASADDEGSGVSRIGLVRVAYEGNCTLSAEVDGNTLRITAEMSLDH